MMIRSIEKLELVNAINDQMDDYYSEEEERHAEEVANDWFAWWNFVNA